MNRPELVKTLNLIKPALATKDIVPIFQCFMFDGDTVSAYNDTVAIAALFKPDEEMTFAVHGNTLLGLLESSLIKDASFALKGNDLILTIGKSISKLPYTSRDEFIFEQPEGPWQVHPFTNSFMEAMELCFETVSTDETQIKLQGVHIQGQHYVFLQRGYHNKSGTAHYYWERPRHAAQPILFSSA
jgi:DNA polymerase III sliding clamp (beta) subunit (PCNA family)